MKSKVRLGLGLAVAGCMFVFAGCGDDDDSSNPGSSGSAGQGGDAHGHGGARGGAILELECKVLGRLCHEADTGTGTAHECHEIGHEGHVDACADAFDGCIEFCTGADGSAGAGPAQDTHCAALGELCDAVDDLDGPLHTCRELGRANDAAKCAERFDDCATQCFVARDLLESGHGMGGAAGGGGVSSGGVNSVGGAASGAGGAP